MNISLLLSALMILMISYAPVDDPVMFFLCAMNGLVQSVSYPACISLVAMWFRKETLGSVVGLWGSCGAVGNVIGAYLTSHLIDSGLTWQATFQLVGLLNLLQIVLNIYLLKEPKEVKVQIDDPKNE